MNTHPLVYIVEDDDDDRHLIRTIFEDYFEDCRLQFFEHGSFLVTCLTHQLDDRLPDLILLDLEMPVLNGFDTLRYLKANPDFKSIPIVVLASSSSEKDITHCYELGGNAFLTKAADYYQWMNMIESLHTYWLETV